jgi:hypothetical protein
MIQDCMARIFVNLNAVGRSGWKFVIDGVRLTAAFGASTKCTVVYMWLAENVRQLRLLRASLLSPMPRKTGPVDSGAVTRW